MNALNPEPKVPPMEDHEADHSQPSSSSPQLALLKPPNLPVTDYPNTDCSTPEPQGNPTKLEFDYRYSPTTSKPPDPPHAELVGAIIKPDRSCRISIST
jgi:hypothetical protein